MKKVWLFPYHPDMELLIEQRGMLKDFLILGVSSYREDQVLIKILNERLGSTGDFDEMLPECDQLILLENYRNCKVEKYYGMIEKAINAGKEVILVPQLKQTLELDKYQGYCEILHKTPELNIQEPGGWEFIKQKKYPVNTPIITVFGMGRNCNKFENQILLKKYLEREGYKTAWIASNPLGALYGGKTMPDFLFDTKLSLATKIIRFNAVVYSIVKDSNPDVLILGVPEGISEFEKYEFNHFAEYALVIGNAVSVDSAILCTYFLDAPNNKGVESIAFHCKEKLGFPVDLVVIGRSGFEIVNGRSEIIYSFFDKKYLEKHFRPVKPQLNSIVESWEENKLEVAIKKLISNLQNNAEAI